MDTCLTHIAEVCAACNESKIECVEGTFRAVGAPTEASLKVKQQLFQHASVAVEAVVQRGLQSVPVVSSDAILAQLKPDLMVCMRVHASLKHNMLAHRMPELGCVLFRSLSGPKAVSPANCPSKDPGI